MSEEYKSLRPTVIVGIGGTGAEVLSRVRRLIEERYGNLNNIPIVSFLWIDTDRGYKVSNLDAAGSSFKDNERCWVQSTNKKIQKTVNNIENYPWINDWFPARELKFYYQSDFNYNSPHHIRIHNRLAFFINYQKIKQKFFQACDRIQNHEQFMSDRYGIEVKDNPLNIFVISSLTGRTGSGMLIDLGYCLRHWLKEKEIWGEIQAMLPMPNAFAGIVAGEHIISNAYAALMELNYFSDERTSFKARYGKSDLDYVCFNKTPFDSTFLLGNQNNESKFSLSQIRELIAQQIYLDLIPTIYLHQVHIRDSLRASSFQTDAEEGRGYSRQFMSFGLSSIEIPINNIYAYLSNRLARDIINSWICEPTEISVQAQEKYLEGLLTKLCITQQTLLRNLSNHKDESIINLIARWIDEIRNDIFRKNRLQCTQQGAKLIGDEQGKILEFTDYLQEKENTFFSDKLRGCLKSKKAFMA